MAWIESHQSLRDHPKKDALCERLFDGSVPDDVADFATIGLLHQIWWWCLTYAIDGDLANFSDRQIARGCRWGGDAQTLVRALIASGFMDEDRKLHDWHDYAGRMLTLKERARKANAQRQQRYRERHRQRPAEAVTRNVTRNVTPSNALTKPNLTIQRETTSLARPTRSSAAQKTSSDIERHEIDTPNRVTLDVDWDEWYAGYANKRQPSKAKPLYRFHRQSGATREQMLTARDNYLADCSLNDRPIQYPATFLARKDPPWRDWLVTTPSLEAGGRGNGRLSHTDFERLYAEALEEDDHAEGKSDRLASRTAASLPSPESAG